MDLHRALFTGYLQGEEYSGVFGMRGSYGDEFLDTDWTDPFPFKAEGGRFGMVIQYRVCGDGYVYAGRSNGAYRAKAGGESQVDASERVMKYSVVDCWAGHKASGVSIDYGQLIAPETHGEIWLDNSDGGLGTLGSGDYAAFKRGLGRCCGARTSPRWATNTRSGSTCAWRTTSTWLHSEELIGGAWTQVRLRSLVRVSRKRRREPPGAVPPSVALSTRGGVLPTHTLELVFQ